MRHAKLNKRFGRNRSARKELMHSLARNTIIYLSIKTTLSKAKEASRLVDKLISLGKKESLQGRRAAFDILKSRTLVARLVNDIAPLFKNRNGGYTKIMRLSNRHGDGAQMAILELVEKPKIEPKSKKKEKVKVQETGDQKPVVETQQEQKSVQKKAEELAKEKKKAKPKQVAKKKPEVPETLIAPKKEIKPEEKSLQVGKEAPQKEGGHPGQVPPKKEGLFSRFKGIFKKKKP